MYVWKLTKRLAKSSRSPSVLANGNMPVSVHHAHEYLTAAQDSSPRWRRVGRAQANKEEEAS